MGFHPNATHFHPNATDAAREKIMKQLEDDREFEIRGAAEPSDEKEPADEERKYHKKIFQPARQYSCDRAVEVISR
jgi:hypothetical protein